MTAERALLIAFVLSVILNAWLVAFAIVVTRRERLQRGIASGLADELRARGGLHPAVRAQLLLIDGGKR